MLKDDGLLGENKLPSKEMGMSLQPIVTLAAAFIGAWLANANFNKQKLKELKDLQDNCSEEINDLKDEMIRVIPKLVKSYDQIKIGMVISIGGVVLTRKVELFILPIALEKGYSKMSSDKRSAIKSIIKIVDFLGGKHDQISSEIMSINANGNNSIVKDVNTLSVYFRSYIFSCSILYYYCNSLSVSGDNYKRVVDSDEEILKKVMSSLSLEFK